MFILAVTKRNSNVTMILTFMVQLVDVRAPLWCRNPPPPVAVSCPAVCAAPSSQVMKEYFGELEEESIRDNFVVTYELLDEVMDFGYPQISETKILKECAVLCWLPACVG